MAPKRRFLIDNTGLWLVLTHVDLRYWWPTWATRNKWRPLSVRNHMTWAGVLDIKRGPRRPSWARTLFGQRTV